MHIHKPDDALLLLGHASMAGRPVLTVTVGYVCEADGRRVSEQEAWQWLMPLFPDEPFDLAEKKAGGGFGVAGDACAPIGTQVEGLMVRAGVGDLEARILVQGDRRWTRTATGWRAGAPQPFQRMPIGLARAYGGAGRRDNPFGRGYAADGEYEGVPLPNIEHPEHPLLKPSDTPPVATLGPQPVGSEGRNRWLGRLDDAWMRTRLPWLPDDTDPRWYDRFAASQCRPEYWRGDEAWFAENMNPQHGLLQGRLPGLRPRLLLCTVVDPERHIELKTDLDTVWLMPNDQRVIVLYRAQTSVKREDAKDILGLAVFTEVMAEAAHPTAYWSDMWRRAIDKEAGRVAAVPVPAALDEQERARLDAAREQAEQDAAQFQAQLEKEIDDELKAAQSEAEEQMRAGGLDPDVLKARAGRGQSDPDGADLFELPALGTMPTDPAAYRAKLASYIDDTLKQGEAAARRQLEKSGLDVDAMLAYSKAHPVVEPSVAELAAQATAWMPISATQRQAYIDEFVAFNEEMEGLGGRLQAQFDEADQATIASLGALDAGRHADALELPAGPRERLTRDRVLDRAAQGASAAWTELEGLDLSGASLAGIDLRRSVLRGCDLRGANLEGADLSEALLEDCLFERADLSRARLAGAHLTECRFVDARLEHAEFSRVLMAGCAFDRAILKSSHWADAELADCGFEAAILTGVRGQRARFTECRLTAADVSAGSLEHADFSQCALEGARFSDATLTGATLLACQASHARFDRAVMPGLRTLLATNLTQANLSGADLQDASLQNTVLAQAELRETMLDRALVKECDLTGTDAWRMVAREADFADSHIAQASWRGVNLMQSRFDHARLLDLDLTGANLHAAQTRTATVQGLTLDGALMTRCRLLEEYGHG